MPLGDVDESLQRYDREIAEYREVLARNPQFFERWGGAPTLLAAALIRLQTRKSSRFHTNFGESSLHFSLGQAYHHVGRDADARKQEAEYQRLKALQRPNAG